MKTKVTFILKVVCLFVLCLTAGCATKGKARDATVFYPPPPDKPRYQFLTSFSDSSEFVVVSPFKLFLMGPPSVFIMGKPYGVTMRHGRMLICDTQLGCVLEANCNDRTFNRLKVVGGGGLNKPVNAAIDSEGLIYVADASKGQVVILDTEGTCLGLLGRKEDMKPTDVAVSADKIYVANLKKSGLDVFDKKSYEYLFSIPRSGAGEEAKLFQPVNIAITPDNKKIYVSDAGGFKIKQFDPDGNFIKSFGQQGDLPGELARPKGIDIDRDGRVYVVDALSNVVQIFNEKDELLMYLGSPGSPASLVLPADVAINYDDIELFREYIDSDFDVEYLVIVTSQFGPRKISVFGFGKKKQ